MYCTVCTVYCSSCITVLALEGPNSSFVCHEPPQSTALTDELFKRWLSKALGEEPEDHLWFYSTRGRSYQEANSSCEDYAERGIDEEFGSLSPGDRLFFMYDMGSPTQATLTVRSCGPAVTKKMTAATGSGAASSSRVEDVAVDDEDSDASLSEDSEIKTSDLQFPFLRKLCEARLTRSFLHSLETCFVGTTLF